jgi:antitoxin component YwqK of YwqJK toxin-antitoxin module
MKPNSAAILRCLIVIIFIAAIGCKPRTRKTEENYHIRAAMMIKMMDDSTAEMFLNNSIFADREKIKQVLKRYENTTGEVEYEDYFFYPFIMTTVLENGVVRSQTGVYENGNTAHELRIVEHGVVKDSTRRYYPAGPLYSRRISMTDAAQNLYEEFFESGVKRSMRYSDTLWTWLDTGAPSGKFIFTEGEVRFRTLWYPNGKKKEESEWLHDTLNGNFRSWDSLGTLTSDLLYKKGVITRKR